MLTVGIDVGSSSVKGVLRGADGTLLARSLERLHRRNPAQVASKVFDLITEGVDCDRIAYVASTGEGEAVSFRTGHFFGMTCHGRGAVELVPAARSAIDVGALHTRALVIGSDGRVLRHRMTSPCASGTGGFVENISRHLGLRLDELGQLSLKAERAESVGGICAVLAETDVINRIAQGVETPALLRGIHESIAGRLARLLKVIDAPSPLLLTGGLALDEGLSAALQREDPALQLCSHPLAQWAGAIGAACLGAQRLRRIEEQREAHQL